MLKTLWCLCNKYVCGRKKIGLKAKCFEIFLTWITGATNNVDMQQTVPQYISIVPSIHTLFSILKTLVLFLYNYSTCMYMWGPKDIFESLFLRCYPPCLFWDRASHCLVDGGLDEIGWPVPGNHLFLPPQHWDEKYTPLCPSFLTWILGVELRTSHLWEVNGDTFHFLLGFLFFVFGFFFCLMVAESHYVHQDVPMFTVVLPAECWGARYIGVPPLLTSLLHFSILSILLSDFLISI